MKYKTIPNTDLEVSVVSLGTWVFGGGEWGQIQEKECIDTVSAAIESGINLIDTAPIYGHGASEKIVGKAIKGRREKVIIATKCGLIGRGVNIKTILTAKSIRTEIDQSLKRLNVEYIDIYQCHWPDRNTPIQETMIEMVKLKKEGKIRHIGLSNYNRKQIKDALAYADIVSLQSHYSLLERSLEKEIIPYCQEKRVGILSYGSLGGGILSGKYKTMPKLKPTDARSFFYKYYDGEGFKKASRIVALLCEVAHRIKATPSQVAVNWIWQKQGVSSAIVGARTPEQARTNALASEYELSTKDLGLLQA